MKTIEERVASVEGELVAMRAQLAAVTSRAVAPDLPEADIESEYGNPEIRKDPPRWKGESCVGRHYSECPADYLRSLAGLLQWKAKKNDEDGKEKYAGYDRRDAARALAWAARKDTEASRYGTSGGGGGSAKHSMPPERDGDDPIPFVVDMTTHGAWCEP